MTTSPALSIRPYRPADLLSLYDICLRTGPGGVGDVPPYRDPLLIGHFYAAPYATLQPDTTFVLDDGKRVVGYVLGVPDSADFSARCEAQWFPILRGLYPVPDAGDTSLDARMIRAIHRGIRVPEGEWAVRYPAHLHIDLLPSAQSGGYGKRLMQTLLAAMEARNVPGIHLGVGPSNDRAVRFYERLGFQLLENSEHTLWYGLRLGKA